MTIDKSIKSYTIPSGTTYIPDEAFKNFRELEEIIIPDSVTEIGNYAFTGCSSLRKVVLPQNLLLLGEFAFANCSSLEEVVFPDAIPLNCLEEGVFSYCTNLKKINIPNNVRSLSNYALFNCRSLETLIIPNSIESLGSMSLSSCGLKSIFIPSSVHTICLGALSYMLNLESIEVDKESEYFLSEDSLSLINKTNNVLVQYALNSKNKKYTAYTYKDPYGELTGEQPLYGIGEFAFAGARNLEELTIYSCIDVLGSETFKNCNKLKKLSIKAAMFSSTNIFTVMPIRYNSNISFPFEEVTIEDGIKTISANSYLRFRNLKTVNLPATLDQIDSKVFYSSKKIRKISIPSSVKTIHPKAFAPNSVLVFSDGTKVLAGDLITVQTNDKYTIFSLRDGTYYVYNDTFGKIKINKDEIKAFSENSDLLEESPDKIIDYLFQIFYKCSNSIEIIQGFFLDKKLKALFLKAFSNINTIDRVTYKKASDYFEELMRQKGYYSETLLNGILMLTLSSANAKILINNYDEVLEAFLSKSGILSVPITTNTKKLLSDVQPIIDYCKLLKKYNKKDKFLFNETFILALSKEEQELLIKNFDSHIKRLIIFSKVLEEQESAITNIKDLFKFCKVMGVFEEHQILRQKFATFITEKIFADELSNKLENIYQIVGDDIHSVFDTLEQRQGFDIEFAMFFLENFKDLIKLECYISGYIGRVYNSFPAISMTSTSNKGAQRHLKVTFKKCYNFLLTNNFNGITPENIHIAEAIGLWFDDDIAFQNALQIVEESQTAPRNIFTSYQVIEDADTNSSLMWFDNNPNHDLRESISANFSYEWLPKQDLDNLLLGKYCSCCAHISGAGAGIMRASIISPDCQNLVIRNEYGDIISKATIYVNRNGKYAIFNTVETNLYYSKEPEYLNKIYEAFMRGTRAFISTYNRNNPTQQLQVITSGQNRNTLRTFMENNDSIHPVVKPYSPIDYSKFQYNKYGSYVGDAQSQRLVLTKKMA